MYCDIVSERKVYGFISCTYTVRIGSNLAFGILTKLFVYLDHIRVILNPSLVKKYGKIFEVLGFDDLIIYPFFCFLCYALNVFKFPFSYLIKRTFPESFYYLFNRLFPYTFYILHKKHPYSVNVGGKSANHFKGFKGVAVILIIKPPAFSPVYIPNLCSWEKAFY